MCVPRFVSVHTNEKASKTNTVLIFVRIAHFSEASWERHPPGM